MELKDKSKALAEAEEKLERLAGYLELEKKKSRLAEFVKIDDAPAAATVGLKAPYYAVEFDFVLSRAKTA